jgi:hypothetical protein
LKLLKPSTRGLDFLDPSNRSVIQIDDVRETRVAELCFDIPRSVYSQGINDGYSIRTIQFVTLEGVGNKRYLGLERQNFD